MTGTKAYQMSIRSHNVACQMPTLLEALSLNGGQDPRTRIVEVSRGAR